MNEAFASLFSEPGQCIARVQFEGLNDEVTLVIRDGHLVNCRGAHLSELSELMKLEPVSLNLESLTNPEEMTTTRIPTQQIMDGDLDGWKGGEKSQFPDYYEIEVIREPQRITIGRNDFCNLFIPHPTVSRLHCTVIVDEAGEITVADCDSYSGVIVNGEKKTVHQIWEDTDIIIGTVTVRLFVRSSFE